MNNISALAFDLDGTIYYGDSAVEDARDAILTLLNMNYQIFYFTNNSAKSQEQIIEKLNRLGFYAKPQNTYCVSMAIASYLIEKKIKNIYLIGSDGLKDELSLRNIKISDERQVDAVVVGLDSSFSYKKIAMAQEAISNGAKLIIANADSSYPIENGRRLPGCGAMVGAILGATGHRPDFIVGKPNIFMLELLCKDHNLTAKDICVVGDSPESDIKMADNFKCQSILFDPNDMLSAFSGNRVRRFQEIISLLNK